MKTDRTIKNHHWCNEDEEHIYALFTLHNVNTCSNMICVNIADRLAVQKIPRTFRPQTLFNDRTVLVFIFSSYMATVMDQRILFNEFMAHLQFT